LYRYHTGGGEHKESAGRLMHSLANIRTITAHFSPKIEAWLASQQLSTPTEEQILELVKSNYDSLTLKLQVRHNIITVRFNCFTIYQGSNFNTQLVRLRLKKK
jgi:hypothetical protein